MWIPYLVRRRCWPSVLLVTILILAPIAASFVRPKDQHSLLAAGRQEETIRNVKAEQLPQHVRRRSEELPQHDSARQDDLVSDGKDESMDNPTDNDSKDAEVSTKEDGSEVADGGEDTGKDSATDDGETSTSDSDSDARTEKAGEKIEGPSDGEAKKDEEKANSDTGESPSGNQTDPFSTFMLMQMVELNSGDAFEQVTIYEHGSLVGPFANAPNTSNIDELSDPSEESWYTDSEYADRIAFQFTYTPESKDYAISEPTVSARSSSGVLPIIQDFKNDPSTGGGSFTVLYRCQRDAPQTSQVSLKLQVTTERAVETIWIKKCGSGRYEHLDFGFTAHNREVTMFNLDGTYGTDEQRTLEVGPLETSTELTMKLTPPAQNLQFLDPFVSSGSDNVTVQLRGTISGGTLSSDAPTSFSILYECKAAVTAEIDFTVEIPPWDNVTAHWRKDCGGSHSQALLIGTTGTGSYDVMQDGELASRYNVTDETTLDEAKGIVEEISADVDSKRFYLTNSDEISDIHIQTITATMSNPAVLAATVNTPLLGASYIPSTGDVIKRKDTKSLSLHFVCKKEGKSLVLVTLPTLRYKNVEFGFIKECYEPKVYHHSGFLQTASSLMAAFLVLGVLAGIGTCVYLRRRQGVKYTAVPTSDSVIP